MKKIISSLTILVSAASYSQTGLVGINTPSPTATFDVNGNARVRTLTNASSNSTFTRNVVADTNGNLGYTDRIAKPTPINAVLTNYLVTDLPITIATGVSLSEFTPVIIEFLANSANVGLPTYHFYDSGGNIIFDMLNPANAVGYNIRIKFIRNN